MLVCLFRDENCRDTFAYSTDVTGRNIPRRSPSTQWGFVAAEQIQGDDFEGSQPASEAARVLCFPEVTCAPR
jgi:hypothetical protein